MAKKPNIRFAGFEDDWEQRKLGEVCVRVTRKNKNNESDLPLTIASQYGLIDQRDFFNKVIAAKDMSNYYLLKKGEFAYNKSYSKGFDYGSIKRLNAYEQGCLSTLYICFSIETDEVDSDYLECFFDTLSWYHDVSAICAEGARNHGLLNVDVEAFFKDVNIEMPSQIQEQRKISVFINTLDHLITLHQRKCDELKKVKKFMLQKMFPKKGEKNPEIRFDGFTNDWEQRKLGEVAEYRNGKAHENNISETGKYVVVNSKFVSTDGEVRKFSAEQIEPLYEGEIAFVLSDVPNGRAIARTFLVDESGKYTLNQRIAGITPNEHTDSYFLHILMNRNKYFLKFDDGNKQTNLSVNDVMQFEERYPSYREQTKIGAYFSTLDHLITLHQRKCEELKNVKKYMLQNMFAKGE